jgi:hypothetical protein
MLITKMPTQNGQRHPSNVIARLGAFYIHRVAFDVLRSTLRAKLATASERSGPVEPSA